MASGERKWQSRATVGSLGRDGPGACSDTGAMGDAVGELDMTTWAAWLRDEMQLAPDVAGRLAALDAGRHPTIAEMRRALGRDLDLSACEEAGRRAWPALGPAPGDAELAALLDAMYRAVASTRLVRVVCGPDGPSPSRVDAPLVLRGGDRLVLLVLADNVTDAELEFSAEAHGEGIGGYIEPQRTGSALFDAGEMHPGSYLLPLMVVAGGRPATLDVELVVSSS